MTGPWFLAPPLWISDLALLAMVAGLAWLAHAVAWRLAGDHAGYRRWQHYRAPTRLAAIAIAVLAVPALIGPPGAGALPWAHLGLLGLIAAGGWLVLTALGIARVAGGGFAMVAVALAVLALALVTFPVVKGLSTVLLACAAVLALVLAAAIGRRVG